LLGEPVLLALQQALASLTAGTPVPLSPENFTRALAERNTLAYRPLLELCRLVAQSLQPPAGAGGPDVSFLLDLERLFERHVTRGLSEEFAHDQHFHLAVQPLFELSGVCLRPDVTVSAQAHVRLIVDAKWKRLRRGGIHQADFYQALAYAAALGSPRVVLVYPGRRDDSWTVPVPHAQLEVEVRTLRVTAGRTGCLRSLEKLARKLRLQCRL
jgi:5-methylcytosine-specific restriction enzyme subunit McrC